MGNNYIKIFNKTINIPIIPKDGIDNADSSYYIVLEDNYLPVTSNITSAILYGQKVEGDDEWITDVTVTPSDDAEYNLLQLSVKENVSNIERGAVLKFMSDEATSTNILNNILYANIIQEAKELPKPNYTISANVSPSNVPADGGIINITYYLQDEGSDTKRLEQCDILINNEPIDKSRIISQDVTLDGVVVKYNIKNTDEEGNYNIIVKREDKKSEPTTITKVKSELVLTVNIDKPSISAAGEEKVQLTYSCMKNGKDVSKDVQIKFVQNGTNMPLQYKLLGPAYKKDNNYIQDIEILENKSISQASIKVNAKYSTKEESLTITQNPSSIELNTSIVDETNKTVTSIESTDGKTHTYTITYFAKLNNSTIVDKVYEYKDGSKIEYPLTVSFEGASNINVVSQTSNAGTHTLVISTKQMYSADELKSSIKISIYNQEKTIDVKTSIDVKGDNYKCENVTKPDGTDSNNNVIMGGLKEYSTVYLYYNILNQPSPITDVNAITIEGFTGLIVTKSLTKNRLTITLKSNEDYKGPDDKPYTGSIKIFGVTKKDNITITRKPYVLQTELNAQPDTVGSMQDATSTITYSGKYINYEGDNNFRMAQKNDLNISISSGIDYAHFDNSKLKLNREGTYILPLLFDENLSEGDRQAEVKLQMEGADDKTVTVTQTVLALKIALKDEDNNDTIDCSPLNVNDSLIIYGRIWDESIDDVIQFEGGISNVNIVYSSNIAKQSYSNNTQISLLNEIYPADVTLELTNNNYVLKITITTNDIYLSLPQEDISVILQYTYKGRQLSSDPFIINKPELKTISVNTSNVSNNIVPSVYLYYQLQNSPIPTKDQFEYSEGQYNYNINIKKDIVFNLYSIVQYYDDKNEIYYDDILASNYRYNFASTEFSESSIIYDDTQGYIMINHNITDIKWSTDDAITGSISYTASNKYYKNTCNIPININATDSVTVKLTFGSNNTTKEIKSIDNECLIYLSVLYNGVQLKVSEMPNESIQVYINNTNYTNITFANQNPTVTSKNITLTKLALNNPTEDDVKNISIKFTKDGKVYESSPIILTQTAINIDEFGMYIDAPTNIAVAGGNATIYFYISQQRTQKYYEDQEISLSLNGSLVESSTRGDREDQGERHIYVYTFTENTALKQNVLTVTTKCPSLFKDETKSVTITQSAANIQVSINITKHFADEHMYYIEYYATVNGKETIENVNARINYGDEYIVESAEMSNTETRKRYKIKYRENTGGAEQQIELLAIYTDPATNNTVSTPLIITLSSVQLTCNITSSINSIPAVGSPCGITFKGTKNGVSNQDELVLYINDEKISPAEYATVTEGKMYIIQVPENKTPNSINYTFMVENAPGGGVTPVSESITITQEPAVISCNINSENTSILPAGESITVKFNGYINDTLDLDHITLYMNNAIVDKSKYNNDGSDLIYTCDIAPNISGKDINYIFKVKYDPGNGFDSIDKQISLTQESCTMQLVVNPYKCTYTDKEGNTHTEYDKYEFNAADTITSCVIQYYATIGDMLITDQKYYSINYPVNTLQHFTIGNKWVITEKTGDYDPGCYIEYKFGPNTGEGGNVQKNMQATVTIKYMQLSQISQDFSIIQYGASQIVMPKFKYMILTYEILHDTDVAFQEATVNTDKIGTVEQLNNLNMYSGFDLDTIVVITSNNPHNDGLVYTKNYATPATGENSIPKYFMLSACTIGYKGFIDGFKLSDVMKYGGDNTSGNGTESIYINMEKICKENDFISKGITELYIDLYARFYRNRYTGKVSVTYNTYKPESDEPTNIRLNAQQIVVDDTPTFTHTLNDNVVAQNYQSAADKVRITSLNINKNTFNNIDDEITVSHINTVNNVINSIKSISTLVARLTYRLEGSATLDSKSYVDPSSFNNVYNSYGFCSSNITTKTPKTPSGSSAIYEYNYDYLMLIYDNKINNIQLQSYLADKPYTKDSVYKIILVINKTDTSYTIYTSKLFYVSIPKSGMLTDARQMDFKHKLLNQPKSVIICDTFWPEYINGRSIEYSINADGDIVIPDITQIIQYYQNDANNSHNTNTFHFYITYPEIADILDLAFEVKN